MVGTFVRLWFNTWCYYMFVWDNGVLCILMLTWLASFVFAVVPISKLCGRHSDLVHKLDIPVSFMPKGLFPIISHDWFTVVLCGTGWVRHVGQEILAVSRSLDFNSLWEFMINPLPGPGDFSRPLWRHAVLARATKVAQIMWRWLCLYVCNVEASILACHA